MNKLTQKRNEKFKAATKAERAVMVAKDALKMLDSGKTISSPGDWVELPAKIHKIEDKSRQICDLSDTNEFSKCKVCALGALMLSEIRHANKLTLQNVVEAHAGWCISISYFAFGKRLDKIFTFSQQKLMEYAFEGGRGLFDDEDVPSSKIEKLDNFYKKHPNEDERLRAILKNIIKNKSIFVV